MDVAFINVFFPHGTMITNISRAAGRDSCINVSSGILRNFFTSFKTFAILVEYSRTTVLNYAAILVLFTKTEIPRKTPDLLLIASIDAWLWNFKQEQNLEIFYLINPMKKTMCKQLLLIHVTLYKKYL